MSSNNTFILKIIVKMKCDLRFVLVSVVLTFVQFQNAFVIPDEALSVYQFLTSKIPNFKLGTDSKFGFGFDLGRHANYQTVIEIGPQTNVEPLDKESKNVDNMESNLVKRHSTNQKDNIEHFSDSDGGKWLERFKMDFINKKYPQKDLNEIGVIDANLVIPKI